MTETMRDFITSLIRLAARIFFRRIEITGGEQVPHESPVIFAVNHPNALIDPLFLLCFAPRRVSFLAKEPLFHMPLIGGLARAFDSIPVYRREDNASTAANRETFARARALLDRGGAIAIFPEGTTHSDPRLRQLKTGAARIALGASLRISVVPTGLYYTAKQTFRSSALVCFGTPVMVEPEAVDAAGEPSPESVGRLTAKIDAALAAVTLQADSHAALELIGRAERIFSAGDEPALAREFELRRRFVSGYAYLRAHDPARLARLESKVARVDAELLAPAQAIRPATVARLLLMPVAIIGAVIHWPLYRLIGVVAARVAGAEEAMVATVKIVAGLILYPLQWIAFAVVAGVWLGVAAGLIALVLQPLLAYTALAVLEALDELRGRLHAARHAGVQLQQGEIREEILAIAGELP